MVIVNAVEKVLSVLKKEFPNERITTSQIATAMGLTRGVTSSYLSKLEKDGRLLKTGTRPVYWEVKAEKSSFDDLIGSRGSLYGEVQKAIEAIVYPPNGLPIFMSGTRGTGKLLFAKSIYNYSIQNKKIPINSQFIPINCDNYKDNFSSLKKDLNDIINNSVDKCYYIYIKNLQALKVAEQQLLFTYANQQTISRIRYILSASTSKIKYEYSDLNNAVIEISLPSLTDRPLNERLSFVVNYLQKQSTRINRQLLISPNELISLANFNNLNKLDNSIQLLCAQAFAKSASDNQLIIGKPFKDSIQINPNQIFLQNSVNTIVNSTLQLGVSAKDLFNKLNTSLENKEVITEQNFLVLKVLKQIDSNNSESILQSLAHSIKQKVYECITKSYGVTFPSDKNFWRNVSLAFTFARLCSENISSAKINHSLQNKIKKQYPRGHYLFKKLLESSFSESQNSDYFWIPFFILMYNGIKKIESIHFNAILLAHGEHTASSIKSVVNNIFGNYIFEAFDMPIDSSLSDINKYIKSYLASQGSPSIGNIVLFDMGSLRQTFREIKDISNHELLVVNNLTTAMALDIGIKIQRNDTFKSIAESSKKYGLTTDTQYFEGISNKKNIIVACMSGVGLSKELKKLIDSTLSKSLEVIAIDYKQLHNLLTNHDSHFFANTQLILTTTDVTSDLDLDIMNVYNIFDQSTSNKLHNILLSAGESKDSCNLLSEKLVSFLSIEGIRERLQILNPDVVIQESQDVVSHYENFYNTKFGLRLKLNLYMHLSLMFERMIINSRSSKNSIDKSVLSDEEQNFFSISQEIFQSVRQKFNIKIQDYEIELLYQLLKDFI